MSTLARLTEEAIVSWFTDAAPMPPADVVVPNGDDAAVYRVPPERASAITTDSLVEGVHFDWACFDPLSVGRKLVAVNVSDLAAMGAMPRYLLVNACIPTTVDAARVQGIAKGVGDACARFGVYLLGGNMSRTLGPMVLSATAVGDVAPDKILTRGGAKPKDILLVSGTLGEARGALCAFQKPMPNDDPIALATLISRWLDPKPRVALGQALAQCGWVHACMDVSDGLRRDVRRLVEPFGLGATIDPEKIPISSALLTWSRQRSIDAISMAIDGGEDYELLFAADARGVDAVIDLGTSVGVALTAIGEITDEPRGVYVMREGARVPLVGGFDHFADPAE